MRLRKEQDPKLLSKLLPTPTTALNCCYKAAKQFKFRLHVLKDGR